MAATDELLDRLAERNVVLPTPVQCRAIRIAANATQQDEADAVGVDRATIARWENGTRSPRGALARRYAEVLEALRRA
jgi:DNA-binding XRE family transcriptional regulator